MQFRNCELGIIFEKLLSGARKRKILFLFLYFLLVFYLSIPSFSIPFLEYGKFRITSVMEERALENNLLFFPKQSWVNLEDVNPNLLRSIISMEDGNFYNHKGIDWRELEKSLKVNERKKRIARGGSTITMQLAKNLYLRTDRNVFRKAKEFIITARLEKEVSKNTILENYINAVEWGDGIFGVKEASGVYFNKLPKDLSVDQCARLAAVIPSPLKHGPVDNSSYVRRRSTIIKGRYDDIKLDSPQAEKNTKVKKKRRKH
jgi:monofunctional biosynthetic peptidoglycan transglycosylase